MNDYEAIRHLLANYCFGTDTGDTQRWADSFTDDIVWEGGAFGRFEGKQAGIAYHSGSGDASKSMRHINTNHQIEIDGDTAKVDSYAQVFDQSGPSPTIVFSGFYRDTLVKQGGRWLISARTLHWDSSSL
jgi:ketosteroid isomerase-like protein